MKSRGLWVLVSVLVVLGLLLSGFGCAAPAPTSTPKLASTPTPTPKPTLAPAGVIKWKMQSAYALVSNYTIFFGLEWAEWVKDITAGRLQIEVLPPGTFASGTDLMPSVGRGTLAASVDFAGSYGETVPISKVESGLPLAWGGASDKYILPYDAFYNRGLLQLVREAYAEYNVYPLAVINCASVYHLGTTFTFKSLDDIKGKKLRAVGVYADYVKALGGLPTVVSGPEEYMALKTGIIDGFISGVSGLKTSKTAELIKYYIGAPSVSPIVSTAHINMDAWKALPDDIKHLLEVNTPSFYANASYKYALDVLNIIGWAIKEHGVKFITLSPEDEAKALSVSLPIWDNVAKSDPRTAKAVEIVKQQMRDYGKMK